MKPVRLEPAALQSRVKYSTTEPLHFLFSNCKLTLRPEFFYFLFYRFFRADVRVGGRKKNKNKIQGRLFFFSDISDVKVGGRKKKITFFSLVFFIEHC